MSLKKSVILPLVMALVSLRADSVQPPIGLLRHVPETTYFSCETSRHKTISLCGTLPGDLQYRYGKGAQMDLQFPEPASNGPQQLLYAHYSRYQTDRSEVTFSRAGTDYAVFDYTENGQRNAGRACHQRGRYRARRALCRVDPGAAAALGQESALRQRQRAQWRAMRLIVVRGAQWGRRGLTKIRAEPGRGRHDRSPPGYVALASILPGECAMLFQVKNLVEGATAITAALRALDGNARVSSDLAAGQIDVSAQLTCQQVIEALRGAGHEAQRVSEPGRIHVSGGSDCCGSCS